MFSYDFKALHRIYTKGAYFACIDLRRNSGKVLKTLGNWPKAIISQKGSVRQLEMVLRKLYEIGYDRRGRVETCGKHDEFWNEKDA